MNFDLSQPVTLRPSRKKLVGFLVAGVIFVAVFVFMIHAGNGSVTIAWIGLVFFGIGIVVFTVMLLPGASYLRLEPGGFTQCSLFRRVFIPWSDVRGFGVTRIVATKAVGVNFEAQAETRLMRAISRPVGWDGTLADTYGMTAEALAELMNQALSNARSRSR